MITAADIKRILSNNSNNTPADDFRIIDSWVEYSSKGADKPVPERKVDYMCYEIEVVNPSTGEKEHLFKALRFGRVRRLPKSAKESRAFMDMHTQVLSSVWENGINFVTVIANIIEPVALGLLFLYGVQGIGRTIDDAKAKAKRDFDAFIGTMQGTYRVLELSVLTSEEGDWLREKMYGMEYITVVRGIPKSHNEGVDVSKSTGTTGGMANPDGQGTLEELIIGMVDHEYVVEILSTPVYIETLKAWSLRTQQDMTDWYGQLQGTKSLSLNLSVPMMYMANQSTSNGWSQAYTDAESISYSEGTSFSTSYSESVSTALSETYGTSIGHSEGISNSQSVSFSNTETEGETIGHTTGVTIGDTIGETNGTTIGTSLGESVGYSHGTGTSHTIGNSEGESFGTSHTVGTTNGETFGNTHTVGESFGESETHTVGESNSWSESDSNGFSRGTNEGTSTSNSTSENFGTSTSESLSHGITNSRGESETITQTVGKSESISQGNSSGVSHGTNSSTSIGSSWSNSTSHSSSTSISDSINNSHSDGISSSSGTNSSQSNGGSSSNTITNTTGSTIGNTTSTGSSSNNTTSNGTSNSQTITDSNTQTNGSTVSNGESSMNGSSTGSSGGANLSIPGIGGINAGGSSTDSSSQGTNTGSSINNSNSSGSSLGETSGTSHTNSNSTGDSKTESISSSVSGSHSEGSSNGTSWSNSNGTSTNKGTSSSDTTGNSHGTSTSNGITNGSSYGGSTTQTNGTSHTESLGSSSNRGQTTTESSGVSKGVTESYSESNTVSKGTGTSHGTGTSVGYGTSKGTSESFSFTNSNGISGGTSISDSYGKSHSVSVSDSESYSRSISNSVSDGTSQSKSFSNSISDGTSESFSNSFSNSKTDSTSQSHSNSVSHSVSNSQSESISNSKSISHGSSRGNTNGTSSSDSTSESESHGTSKTNGTSEGVSNGTSASKSRGTSRGESIGTSGAYASGTASSMGLGPSIGYSKSYQWVDQQVKDIIELLEFQNQRIKKALRGAGAMYSYVYIACPTLDALSTAMAVAKSTWQNEFALTCPLQVLNLNEYEQNHLLYHFSAFSTDVTRENVAGAQEYKYATVLLPGELTAYTHLPRISEGGVYANVEDVPKFAVPSMLKGEIYLGTILSAERYSFYNGYATPFDYRIGEEELMHGVFTGASRSGKTVAAIRFAAELSRVRRKSTGKRLRLVCMDPKTDWRALARYVEPERFKFYSLGNINFHPIKLNPCKIPKGVWPQIWIDGLIDIYCRAYGLLERGKQMMGETIYALYEEAGVFAACDKENWQEIVPELSKRVTFAKICQRMTDIKQKLEDPTNPKGRAGNDTRDAYARLLDRLQAFTREFSIERRLFSSEDGMGVDDLIGNDDVIVLESSGLESTFSNFIFGIITSGFYKSAKAHENGFLSKDQYETVLFIEEANKVLTGNDTCGTGGGGAIGLSGQSEFEEILDQAAGWGLFIFAITQKIADMPSSVIANVGMIFAGRQVRPDDVAIVVRKIAREERYEDRDLVKWFPRAPIGWLVCQSSRGFDFKSAEPVLVKIARLNNSVPNNEELDEILVRQRVINAMNDAS